MCDRDNKRPQHHQPSPVERAFVLVSGPRSRGFRAYTCLARYASRSRLWESPAHCRGWLDPSAAAASTRSQREISLYVYEYVCVCVCWFMPTVIGMNHGGFAREDVCWVLSWSGPRGTDRERKWPIWMIRNFFRGKSTLSLNQSCWDVLVSLEMSGLRKNVVKHAYVVDIGIDSKALVVETCFQRVLYQILLNPFSSKAKTRSLDKKF